MFFFKSPPRDVRSRGGARGGVSEELPTKIMTFLVLKNKNPFYRGFFKKIQKNRGE
jgi:hypothetical protein